MHKEDAAENARMLAEARPSDDEELAELFVQLRGVLCLIEHKLGEALDSEYIKEYDKAVVVMKVGAKVMKRELTRRGFRQLGKTAKARVQ